MPAHSKVVIDKFCTACDWLSQCWQLRRRLFDDNPDWDSLKKPHYEHFFYRLSVILHEYCLHQLVKLHDPAAQGGNINLTIDYIIEYGQWDDQTRTTLCALRDKMTVLSKPIRSARNKLLSHNDLLTILQDQELGAFEQGKDEEYFTCLIEFATTVRQAALGEPFVHDDLVGNDVEFFMHCFLKGQRAFEG